MAHRPPGWLTCSEGGRVPPPSRARAHPPPQEGSWMGSPPTLDPGPNRPQTLPARPSPATASYWSTCRPRLPSAGMSSATGPSTRSPAASAATWTPATATTTTAWPPSSPHTHPDLARDPIRDGERTFDRLNPDYGVPADQRSRFGRQAVRDGRPPWRSVRVAVHDSRQNDRNRAIWQSRPGLPHGRGPPRRPRPAHRARHGPERTGSER